jgi:hypothetical protein
MQQRTQNATAAVAQTQAKCFQLCCHAATPPQPKLFYTEESLHDVTVFAPEYWLVFSYSIL